MRSVNVLACSDARAFLNVIQASPDDDDVRLVFADWLEENGEGDRAALIRIQIEILRAHVCRCAPSLFVYPDCPVCVKVSELRKRLPDIANLADQFRPTVDYSWGVALNETRSDTPISFVRRGFVEEIAVPSLHSLFERFDNESVTFRREFLELARVNPIQRVTILDRLPNVNFRYLTFRLFADDARQRTERCRFHSLTSRLERHEIPYGVLLRMKRTLESLIVDFDGSFVHTIDFNSWQEATDLLATTLANILAESAVKDNPVVV